MQVDTQRIIADPPNFARAYSYCPKTGFYKGLVHRQPNPRCEGEFLNPAFTTQVKPVFLEGHIPKWNGEAWELVPRAQAEVKAETVERVIDDARAVVVREMREAVIAMVREEFQKQASDFKKKMSDAVIKTQDLMHNQTVLHVESILKSNGDEVVREISQRMETVMQDLRLIETRAHDVHSQTLNAANLILEQVEADRVEVAEHVVWWKRLFASKEKPPEV